jgi:hypothetical protein
MTAQQADLIDNDEHVPFTLICEVAANVGLHDTEISVRRAQTTECPFVFCHRTLLFFPPVSIRLTIVIYFACLSTLLDLRNCRKRM